MKPLDTLEPDIFSLVLPQYRGFPLSEVKNLLMTPVWAKNFVIFMEFFYCVLNLEGLLREVPVATNIFSNFLLQI